MFSQIYTRPEDPPAQSSAGAIDEAFDIATDPFMVPIHEDHVAMGNLLYDFLNCGTQEDPTPHFSDWLGHPVVPDNAWNMGEPSSGYVAEQSALDFTIPSPSCFPDNFPLTPSPPPSQTSTPERQQPELSPHESSCHQASPFFETIRKKWTCDACGRDFRGHWECKRHIRNAGRRAVCLACNKNINGRDDSLRRHYYKHCKKMDSGRDSANLGFEDAFVHV